MLGTVGPPVPYVEVRLESVPEMGYDALSSESPRGEICIRGDTLFSGYYKREDLTKEVLVDGWFHTGMDLYIQHLCNCPCLRHSRSIMCKINVGFLGRTLWSAHLLYALNSWKMDNQLEKDVL
jgi:hypothetical protein